MRPIRVTCTVLAALLVFCIFNSVWLSRRHEEWNTSLLHIDSLVREERWNEAESQLERLYADWQSVQIWLHIIIEHEELDEAESLFCRAMVLAEEEDSVEFRAHIADLLSQLRLLRELEELSLPNVL